eukprot:Rmarinus@m.20554
MTNSSSSIMEAALREGLQCSMCENTYDNRDRVPTSLPCLHTFCSACLQKLLDSETEIPCTICCRKATVDSIESLEKNYYIADLVRLLQHASNNGRKRLYCNICPMEDETQPEYFCGNCDAILCFLHAQLHERSRTLRTHALVPVSVLPTAMLYKVMNLHRDKQQVILHCAVHKDEKLRYYCKGCDELLCLDCYNTQHKLHMVQDIDESLAENRKRRLNELCIALRESLLKRSNICTEGTDLTESLRKVDSVVHEIIRQV